MTAPVILHLAEHLAAHADQALRSVLHQGGDINVVLWQIPAGASLPLHRHPQGEDVWVLLQGRARLQDDDNSGRLLTAGDTVIIGTGQAHGLYNDGSEDCVLLSLIRPQAGFQALSANED
ncbi:quercetin dioxygenase-like cupin family protein [Neisseria sp. HSC-16F19]|nr:cupin domain-containing protein [Neisseria sp. HSC-16F19]MCP2040683.1 quercetin dioxygenase-like cupin family protein [Neisseria sp. HSC-16F19]